MTPDDHIHVLGEIDTDIKQHKRAIRKLLAVRQYHQRKLKLAQIAQAANASAHEPNLLDCAENGAPKPNYSTRLEAAAAVLREAGKPLQAADIAKRMIDGGYIPHNIPSFRNSLHMHMVRNPTVFHKSKEGGSTYWSLCEWHNGQANGVHEEVAF